MHFIGKKPAIQYSVKTWDRMKEVKEVLSHYQESMERLTAFLEKRTSLYGKGYTKAAEVYRRTADDDARTLRTLAQLKMNVALLTRELEVLQEFGA